MDHVFHLTVGQLASGGVLIFLIGCVVGAFTHEPKEKSRGHFY